MNRKTPLLDTPDFPEKTEKRGCEGAKLKNRKRKFLACVFNICSVGFLAGIGQVYIQEVSVVQGVCDKTSM